VPLTNAMDQSVSSQSMVTSGTWSVRGTAHTAVTWVTGVISRRLVSPAADSTNKSVAIPDSADAAVCKEPVDETLLKSTDFLQKSADVASDSAVASATLAKEVPLDGGDTSRTGDSMPSSAFDSNSSCVVSPQEREAPPDVTLTSPASDEVRLTVSGSSDMQETVGDSDTSPLRPCVNDEGDVESVAADKDR
jgi:hypothetical protein